MPATDDMIRRLAGEIEEQQTFQDKLLDEAQKAGRDLTENEMELFTRSRDEMKARADQLDPLKQAAEIAASSRQMLGELQIRQPGERTPEVEYRTAGAFILDYWQAAMGVEQAVKRQQTFNRAASHQTTADNPGLIPTPIVGPVVNFIDEARPLVGALGPRQLPSGTWSRPKVTQHTTVGAQTSEKAELTSQKMTIAKLAVTPTTYGGYVNVSRQDIDWSQPQAMDIIIADLAAQYAIATEKACCAALVAGGTAGGTIPATPTGDVVAGQLWVAAAAVYTATKGQGAKIAVCSPDVLGILGPLFQPVNPMNQQGQGFTAAAFGQGIAGYISGIPVIVSTGFAAAKTLIVMSTAAAEVYEDRIGSLQVIEPSVLGVQVAYAGYFTQLIVEATGIQKVTVT
jgi:HK97 family phage major capsid protein